MDTRKFCFYIGQLLFSFVWPLMAMFAVHQLFGINMSGKYWAVWCAITVIHYTFNPVRRYSQYVEDEKA